MTVSEETNKMLHQIHGELIEFRAETKTRTNQLDELLKDHDYALNGDGNGVPGLRMRTDRLEQSTRAREKHIWAIWTAVLGGAFAWATGWFNRP